jgi:Domain of unknown function DUF29
VNNVGSNNDHDRVGLAPVDQPPAAERWEDFYSWLMQQAEHVRTGNWEAVDHENLAEELESLGREQFNKLESALRVLMMHMLSWDYQPGLRSRSWALSIEVERIGIDNILSDNPGLRPRIAEAIERAYHGARIEAANETGLEKDEFPQECPYSWDDLVEREFTL